MARSAADTWTPVVLELGGKDPFVVCEDADVDSIVQTACRGVWQNMGQVTQVLIRTILTLSSRGFCRGTHHPSPTTYHVLRIA